MALTDIGTEPVRSVPEGRRYRCPRGAGYYVGHGLGRQLGWAHVLFSQHDHLDCVTR